MPIYEFRCQKCEHRFEKLCSMGEDGKNLNCPECGASNPNRVMSAFRAQGSKGEENSGGASSRCGSCSSSNCGSCGL
ncbi:MAG: zinc ribbon domain-containing protein [Firmicutes bacterium]|nr:zinc ribbon domain-containing protein [Bacillota bacterium]